MASKKGVFFDEGGGYLFVQHLGKGVFGSASLVRSIKNGRLYVRKEDLCEVANQDSYLVRPNKEVSNAHLVADIDSVTKCKGWVKYENTATGKVFYVTYWNYCNVGTLEDVWDRFQTEHVQIPEVWIAYWLKSMTNTMLEIHEAGVFHCDAHIANWLFDQQGDLVPEIKLGDWGCSQQTADFCCDRLRHKTKTDFAFVFVAISELISWQRTSFIFRDIVNDFGHYLKQFDRMDIDIPHFRRQMETIKTRARHHSLHESECSPAQFSLVKDRTPDKNFTPYQNIQMIDNAVSSLKVWKVVRVSEKRMEIICERAPPIQMAAYNLVGSEGLVNRTRHPLYQIFDFVEE